MANKLPMAISHHALAGGKAIANTRAVISALPSARVFLIGRLRQYITKASPPSANKQAQKIFIKLPKPNNRVSKIMPGIMAIITCCISHWLLRFSALNKAISPILVVAVFLRRLAWWLRFFASHHVLGWLLVGQFSVAKWRCVALAIQLRSGFAALARGWARWAFRSRLHAAEHVEWLLAQDLQCCFLACF